MTQSQLEDGQFRLVRFINVTAPLLECETHVFELSQTPSFKAISYTCGPAFLDLHWEDDSDKLMAMTEPEEIHESERHIITNGKEHVVSSNMLDAIRILTYCDVIKFPDQWAWVDALCIDQQNLTEIAQQIELMMRIFTEADKVLVWLGASFYRNDSDTELVVDLINTLEPAVKRYNERHAIATQVTQDDKNQLTGHLEADLGIKDFNDENCLFLLLVCELSFLQSSLDYSRGCARPASTYHYGSS